MKITSGEYKYRNIEVPRDIRPTTEKVREAIFSMIRDWIPEAVVLDLFSGSGALGLEALSRGAAKCYFNEKNRANFKILLGNIANCKAEEVSIPINMDYQTCIAGLSEPIDVVIMDPPYAELGYYDDCFDLLQENNLLEKGSVVIAEHLYNNPLKESYGNLTRIKDKKYGTIGVDIYIMN